MLYVITGGSGSGKSEYAEKVAVNQHNTPSLQKGNLYYIATMQPIDEESFARIGRHRNMREGKGFTTIECYTDLARIQADSGDVLLLECMSNLLANEMFSRQGRLKDAEISAQQLEEIILSPIIRLKETAGCLVIVTNEIFSDGRRYGEETEQYIRALGQINQRLANIADGVAEVVCAIPVCRKGEPLC